MHADLGDLLRLRHRPDEALPMLASAAAMFEDGVHPASLVRTTALTALSEAQLDSGDRDAARLSAAQAL